MTRDEAIKAVREKAMEPNMIGGTYIDTTNMTVDALVALGVLKLDEPAPTTQKRRKYLAAKNLDAAHRTAQNMGWATVKMNGQWQMHDGTLVVYIARLTGLRDIDVYLGDAWGEGPIAEDAKKNMPAITGINLFPISYAGSGTVNVGARSERCEPPAEHRPAASKVLDKIEKAIRDYHLDLDERRHGGSAMSRAINAIEQALELPWVQGREKTARIAASDCATREDPQLLTTGAVSGIEST